MWFLKSGHRHIKSETLNEYLDGRLGGSDLAKIEGRWPTCDSCQDKLEKLRAIIAVVVLAALVSVDATGRLSPAADSHEVFVATAPQNRATAPPTTAATVADTSGATALKQRNPPSAKPPKRGEASAAFTVTAAPPPSDSTATEETGPLSAASANAAEPLPEPAQAPARTVELAPASEVDETAYGTSVWWRALEGVAAAAAWSFVAVLIRTRRSSRNCAFNCHIGRIFDAGNIFMGRSVLTNEHCSTARHGKTSQSLRRGGPNWGKHYSTENST